MNGYENVHNLEDSRNDRNGRVGSGDGGAEGRQGAFKNSTPDVSVSFGNVPVDSAPRAQIGAKTAG